MSEKFESTQKEPEDIAKYMVERLKSESEEGETEKKEELSAGEIKEGVSELTDLTLEKEDLIRAINSDESFISSSKRKKEKSHLTQTEIIKGLENLENFDFRKISHQLDSSQNIESAVDYNKKKLKEIRKRIGELANNPQIAEKYKGQLEERIETIRLARQIDKGLRPLIEGIDFAEQKLLAHRDNEDTKLTKTDKKVLEKNRLICEKADQKIRELMGVPEVYYEVNRRELLEYRRELLRDGFVETESVKEIISKIRAHLELGAPVLLRGHLGAGKTEVLLHIARKYYGAEPEFISGSEEAVKYDFTGKTQIGTRSEEDKATEFKVRIDEYRKMFPDATQKEFKSAEKQYYDEIVVKGRTTSFFQYGPLIRAMKDGKPLVIDELDGIPHSILMRLNHILTRRPGDVVTIQENGGEKIKIKKGFCVMATANIKSARYKREELDAAFLSRWWSSEVRYLPPDETLKILTAYLVDKRGSLDLNSADDFKSLKRLVQSADEIQKIFSGEKTDIFGEGGEAARGVSANLEKSVLSTRDIWNIVRPWKIDNFANPLGNYIFTEFIKKATVQKDAVYLTQLFCRFGFFKDWNAEKFGITGLDEKKLEAFKSSKTQ